MRIQPIEQPTTLLARIAYWGSHRMLGKVMTPMKVIFARFPKALFAHMHVVRILDGKMSLAPDLKLLLQTHTAGLNGCGFCVDIGRAMAVRRGEASLDKMLAVQQYRSDPRFTERERAALAYVEEATRNKHVTDATFATLRQHFSEAEIVEITWLNAVENYFNLMNIPLGIESDGLCAIAERRAAA
jgi:AhpD family alkylhydroperoxidase